MERMEMSGRNIEHILLAEFDIDKGSTLKHQIPGPIPNYADEYTAALMLNGNRFSY
jgi:hypothetical protein